MNSISSMNNFLFRLVAFGLLFLAVPANAEETEKVKELQRANETQQRQIEALQRQLDAQMQMMIQLQSKVEGYAKSTDNERVTPREGGDPTQSPSESGKEQFNTGDKSTLSSTSTIESREPRRPKKTGVAQADKLDSQSPTGVDVSYFDPAAVINIPGTKTSIGLHGFAMFQIAHDTNGPASNQFNTASIPIDDVPSETKFNVNPSRIAFSSATAVPDGKLNTLISMDFNGLEETPEPRLRLAYGEYVNEDLGLAVLGGQSFATMVDMRAVPETVDFAAPAGSFAQRQGLLRLTKSFSGSFLMETSIETPQNVRYINAEKEARLPDVVLAGTWLLNGDYLRHFRLNALARDLRAQGADGATDSALGWAIAASAKVDLPFLGKRDNLRLNVHGGDGYGTQLKGGPEEAVFDTASSELDTIGVWSLSGGIQHFWTEEFRSNLTYGNVSADNPASVPSDALDSTTYASANFIWTPFKKLTLGVEYLWGRRENVDGNDGTSNRLLFSSRFDF
jgi:hypothetical protein